MQRGNGWFWLGLVSILGWASVAEAGRFGGGGGGFSRGGGGFGGGGGFSRGGGGYSGGRDFGGGGGGFSRGGFEGGGASRGGFESRGEFGGSSPFSRPETANRSNGFAGESSGAVHGPYGGSMSGASREGGFSNSYGSGAYRSQYGEASGAYGGSARGGSRYGSYEGAYGGSFQGGSAGGVYQGPRGSVYIGHAHAGEATGPNGRTVGGAGATGVVIGPNGNVHGGHADVHGVSGPSGSAITGRQTSVTSGAGGTAITHRQGGIAQGAGGTTVAGGSREGVATGADGRTIAGSSRAGFATGPEGTIAGGSRSAVAVGPNGAVAAGGRAVAGAGAYGAGYAGTRYVAGATINNQAYAVRGSYRYYNAFTPNWYRNYPGAWYAAGWIGGSAWTAATWGACTTTVGYPVQQTAYAYNYGDNIVYQTDGNVYDDNQVLATQADYASQAQSIADAGREAMPADDEQWQPLGVFAMVQGDETTSDNIFQFALNSSGVVRGNYYNAVTDSTVPIYGKLDKKTQRVAWSVGNKQDVVYEAGLYNLTQDHTTMLAHFGKDRTEQYTLVRIPPQQQGGQPGNPPAMP